MVRITFALLLVLAAGAAVYFTLRDSEHETAQPARVGSINARAAGTHISVDAAVVAAASPLVSVRFEWGDGLADDLAIEQQAGSWTVRAEHSYAAAGSYEIALIASFADGTTVESTRAIEAVSVGPAAPPSTPTSTSTATATETTTATATATPTAAPTSAPTAPPTTPTSTPTPPPTQTETPTPEPTETATATPTGPQPPTARIVQLSATDLSATVTVVFADPEGALVGSGIDWGDGTVEEVGGGSVTRSHVYAAPGTYTVTAFALDAQGLEGATAQPVTVLAGG